MVWSKKLHSLQAKVSSCQKSYWFLWIDLIRGHPMFVGCLDTKGRNRNRGSVQEMHGSRRALWLQGEICSQSINQSRLIDWLIDWLVIRRDMQMPIWSHLQLQGASPWTRVQVQKRTKKRGKKQMKSDGKELLKDETAQKKRVLGSTPTSLAQKNHDR